MKKYQSVKIKDLVSDNNVKDRIYKIINSNKQYLLLYKYYCINEKRQLTYFEFIQLLRDSKYNLSDRLINKIIKEKIIYMYTVKFMEKAKYNKKYYSFAAVVALFNIKDKLLNEHVYCSRIIKMSYEQIRRELTHREIILLFY